MLNTNFLLNLVLFALFEFNLNWSSTAEIIDLAKQNNSKLNSFQSNLISSSSSNVQSKAHPHHLNHQKVIDFEWDLDTAAGHKKEVCYFFLFFSLQIVTHSIFLFN